MLEVEVSSINITLLSKNIIFLKNNNIKFLTYNGKKIKNLQFLQKNCCFYNRYSNFLSPKLTVLQNLLFVQTLFNTSCLISAFFSYFELKNSILNQYPPFLTTEEAAILLFFPFFIKNCNIWFVELEEEIFSKNTLTNIKNLFISKANNSSGIIFYQTKTELSLNIAEEIKI